MYADFMPLELSADNLFKGGVQVTDSTLIRRRVCRTCDAKYRRQATSYFALVCTSVLSALRA